MSAESIVHKDIPRQYKWISFIQFLRGGGFLIVRIPDEKSPLLKNHEITAKIIYDINSRKKI